MTSPNEPGFRISGRHVLFAVIAFADSDDVRIGHLGALVGNRRADNVRTGLKRVVGVDDAQIDVGQRARHLRGLDLDKLKLVRVLGNVQHGRGLTGGRVQLEQAVELQQTQRAGFVGGVVRDGDGRAVRDGPLRPAAGLG